LLEKREISIRESGSIAEAALRLSGIFEDAQRAADTYLAEIRRANPAPWDQEEKFCFLKSGGKNLFPWDQEGNFCLVRFEKMNSTSSGWGVCFHLWLHQKHEKTPVYWLEYRTHAVYIHF
jgi:hypothetical protein